MRIGLALPHVGPLADVDAVRLVAREAEASGYDGLWALDRLLAPLSPRSIDPAAPAGAPPVEPGAALDPIGVLALAAACTTTIGIGTSVLVAPWYPPVLLARALTTLDHVSDGRLTVGLGAGWSVDDHEAAGAPFDRREERLDEALDVLEAVWRAEVVAFEGAGTRITPSTVLPKPRQRPRPRLLLDAATGPGLARVAGRADGWMPALPLDAVGPMRDRLHDAAAGYGRAPETVEVVLRADVTLFDSPLGEGRPSFWGNRHQVAWDLVAARTLGVDEVVVACVGSARTAEELLEIADDLTERVREPVASCAVGPVTPPS